MIDKKLINSLRKCTSREDIDTIFKEYKIFDLHRRVLILRKAMNCLMISGFIKNPRIKREKISSEERLKMMYEAEKTSFLDDLGFS